MDGRWYYALSTDGCNAPQLLLVPILVVPHHSSLAGLPSWSWGSRLLTALHAQGGSVSCSGPNEGAAVRPWGSTKGVDCAGVTPQATTRRLPCAAGGRLELYTAERFDGPWLQLSPLFTTNTTMSGREAIQDVSAYAAC